MPGAAPGPGQSLSPGFIQARRHLQIPQFGASSLSAPSTSRTSTRLGLGPFLCPGHFLQGWPEGSTHSPCWQRVQLPWASSSRECPCSRKCWREPRAKESPLQAMQCVEVFPVIPPQKKADGWVLFENFSQVEPSRGLFTGRICYNKYPDASPRVCVCFNTLGLSLHFSNEKKFLEQQQYLPLTIKHCYLSWFSSPSSSYSGYPGMWGILHPLL